MVGIVDKRNSTGSTKRKATHRNFERQKYWKSSDIGVEVISYPCCVSQMREAPGLCLLVQGSVEWGSGGIILLIYCDYCMKFLTAEHHMNRSLWTPNNPAYAPPSSAFAASFMNLTWSTATERHDTQVSFPWQQWFGFLSWRLTAQWVWILFAWHRLFALWRQFTGWSQSFAALVWLENKKQCTACSTGSRLQWICIKKVLFFLNNDKNTRKSNVFHSRSTITDCGIPAHPRIEPTVTRSQFLLLQDLI